MTPKKEPRKAATTPKGPAFTKEKRQAMKEHVEELEAAG